MVNNFIEINTRKLLEQYFDDLCYGAHQMVRKTGSHGHSGETIIKMMLTTVGRGDGYLLASLDENEKFQGFIYAIYVPSVPPWIDFIGMWTRAGLASTVKHEAFKLLKEWGTSKGCKSILAGITRKPEIFFKFFHEPLGFKKIGIILEYDLEKEVTNAN